MICDLLAEGYGAARRGAQQVYEVALEQRERGLERGRRARAHALPRAAHTAHAAHTATRRIACTTSIALRN